MAEFIRLDEQEQEAPILPDYPHSISNIKPDTKIIDGVIEKEEVEGICADYDVITIDKIDSIKVEEEGVDTSVLRMIVILLNIMGVLVVMMDFKRRIYFQS